MSDYERFLGSARDDRDHIGRIAAQLLRERRIGEGMHDALVCAARHLLEHSYMAGLCEPEGVESVTVTMPWPCGEKGCAIT